MKHCPACNFSFPDFHRVCDFDGTELVPDSEPLSLVPSSPASRFRSTLQSPVFWGGLLAFAVVANTFLFALYDAHRRATLAVNDQPSPATPAAIGSVTPSAQTRELWPNLSSKPGPSPRADSHISRLAASPASQRRLAKTSRTLSRHQNTYAASRPNRYDGPARPASRASASQSVLNTESANPKQQQSPPARRRNLSSEERPSEIAARSDSRRTSPEKDGKLTSMLKATWHVLKKPFRF